MIFTWEYWSSALERALKTAAQTAIAIIGTGQVVSVVDVDWQFVAGATATATILSLLTSLASLKVGPEGPSLGQEVPLPRTGVLVAVDDKGKDDVVEVEKKKGGK